MAFYGVHCRLPYDLSVTMKKICAITMVRNDEFFLRKWISYYGQQLGEENLYVYLDGKDQPVPQWKGKANVIPCERRQGTVAKSDKMRIDFLSDMAAELLKRYDMVIGIDVDEFLVVEPSQNKSLREYLSEIKCAPSVSGLGVDVGQHMGLETDIDPDKTFLSQRRFGVLSSRYTKTSVISEPVRWGSGFHRVKGHNFRIDPNLYLFHFGCIDLNMLRLRINDKDRLDNGWSKHLAKRAKTITVVSGHKAREWEKSIPFMRRVESCCRQLFAWNKPSTCGFKWVVRIPERFENVL